MTVRAAWLPRAKWLLAIPDRAPALRPAASHTTLTGVAADPLRTGNRRRCHQWLLHAATRCPLLPA